MKPDLSEIMLLSAVVIHTLILAAIIFVPPELWESGSAGGGLFAAAFLSCGLCAGCYFPIAARRLADCGLETARIGGKLETADHLGSAAGGVATSMVLVPVLGTRAVLLVFIVLMLANIPVALLALLKPHRLRFAETSGPAFRRLGYVLLGVAATIIVCSNILVLAGARLMPSLPPQTAQALIGELPLQQVSIAPETIGRQTTYFKVRRTDPNTTEPAGYVFSSNDFAPEIRGFGGKINLAIYIDTAFDLIDFQLVRSNETPSYLLGPEPFAEIDTVSGATVSSQAILLALRDSANTFARDVLHVSAGAGFQKARPAAKYVPDAHAAYLAAAVVLTLIVIYVGGFWTRLILLAVTCVVGGFIFNAQYSTEQIVTAQELLSYVIPKRFKRPLSIDTMQKARFVKYAILFLLIAAFFVSRDRTTLSADPLITVFGIQFSLSNIRWPTLNWQSASPLILMAVLAGSTLYTRFWCRYLCPAGAFLSLFNKLAVLRRFLPARKFGRCEFGLTAKDQLDCISCDRCRYELIPPAQPARLTHADDMKTSLLSRTLVLSVLTVAVLISAVSIDRLVTVLPAYEDYTASSIASGGQPRDVDLRRIEDLIRQNKLSDREAEFYRKLDQHPAN